ncbi:unnamed protein product [Allacma fusca]|uniref:MD-2-related lipid-recognition domain-containing protein n=1 Tax=Allacma fusca TaxID=39272 RepID=A0A8J2KGP5_9HEXA|nr:unnamed protein product [Allacma fusca]
MNKVYILLAISCAFVGLASSEVILNNKCTGRSREASPLSTVHEIQVEPCANADGEIPCEFQRGENSTAIVTISFTPQQKHKKLKATMVWATGSIDLPFRGMPSNACRSLIEGRCPTTPNQRMTWSAAIPILPSFPANTYPLKLKIQDGSKFVVCQQFRIKLI